MEEVMGWLNLNKTCNAFQILMLKKAESLNMHLNVSFQSALEGFVHREKLYTVVNLMCLQMWTWFGIHFQCRACVFSVREN